MMATITASSLLFRFLSPLNRQSQSTRFCTRSALSATTSKSPLFQSPSPFLSFSRPNLTTVCTAKPSKTKKLPKDDFEDADNLDEDALEALFSQLEEDLKNDNLSADDFDDDISEGDLARLEQELEDAFGDESGDEFVGPVITNTDDAEGCSDDDTEDDEEPLKLKTWQLRRLAYALKIGKRKTNIKSLAGELGLERATVLELLREPPPDLLLMSASLPDKVTLPISGPKSKPDESLPVSVPESNPINASKLDVRPKAAVKEPIHVIRKRWALQKRMKKVQLETLERVYLRTKRPTNAMISSIVHLTNLPRKRVINWFEEKRQEDGVPNQRLPYKRSVPGTLTTN